MSVHGAEPGDIYADANGKLWRILFVVHEPTVTAEEIEGTLFDPNATTPPTAAQGLGQSIYQGLPPQRARIEKRKQIGAVGGLMWNGWKRIWRKDDAP